MWLAMRKKDNLTNFIVLLLSHFKLAAEVCGHYMA